MAIGDILEIIRNRPGNLVQNGAMDFWQRGSSFAGPLTGGEVLADRMKYSGAGAFSHSASRVSGASIPTITQMEHGTKYALEINALGIATPVTTDFSAIHHRMEGFVTSPVLNKKVSGSFWVYADNPGIYSYSIQNGTQSHSLVKEYTINAASTWEKKFVTFSVDANLGGFNIDEQRGFQISLCMGVGTTYATSTLDVWQPGFFVGSTNQVNNSQAIGDKFRVTNIMLNEGPNPAPFFERSGVNIATELGMCQRMYEKSYDLDIVAGFASASSNGIRKTTKSATSAVEIGWVQFAVSKRIPPVALLYSPDTGAAGAIRDVSGGNDLGTTFHNPGHSGGAVIGNAAVTGKIYWWHWDADAGL